MLTDVNSCHLFHTSCMHSGGSSIRGDFPSSLPGSITYQPEDWIFCVRSSRSFSPVSSLFCALGVSRSLQSGWAWVEPVPWRRVRAALS